MKKRDRYKTALTVAQLKDALDHLPEDLVDAPVLMLGHPVTEIRYRCSENKTAVHLCSESVIVL